MNRFYVIREDGSSYELSSNSAIKIFCNGTNNTIEIYEPFVIKNLKIQCSNNCYIQIGKNSKITSLTILSTRDGHIKIGDNCTIVNCSILSRDPNASIDIGNNCLISSEVEIRNSDSHSVYYLNNDQQAINTPKHGVHIGDHVWIGARVGILKDARIQSDSVVGYGSIVTGRLFPPNSCIAGNPARVIKENIQWDIAGTYYFNKLKDNKG